MKVGLLLIVLFISISLVCCNSNDEATATQQDLNALRDSLNYYRSLVHSLSDTSIRDSSVINSFFGRHEIARLRMRGFRNAPREIIDDLQSRADLIPEQSGLGGSMHFWNIQLIRTQWALAEFTDGHVTGTLLLNYQKGEDGKLQWKVLDQHVD